MTGAYTGKIAIVDEKECFLNQRVLKIDCISKAFIYIFLKLNKKRIFNLAHGSGQPNLSLKSLNNMTVNYSIGNITSFKKYDYLFWLIVNLSVKIKKLRQIKDILLDKYF